jgi:hypothetical protein
VGNADDSTPPISSPRHSAGSTSQYSEKLSELPTPRVDHTRGKRDLARIMKEKGGEIRAAPLSFSRTHEDASEMQSVAVPNADAFPGLPLVPNLSHGGSTMTEESPSNFHNMEAPRSVLLEELQLVRMESGVSGPKWRTKYELDQTTTSIERRKRQQSENIEKLREASAMAVDPADDPRNSIQHIRKDLTISSDASQSLSSKISFSELKLDDVIGGGGFGQVWRATWKGTPVAVKVLTGSAQAETVPRAVLEEFVAEINLVSGMRHPNVCLFLGACMEAPNRAIVTELCENGELPEASTYGSFSP